MPVSRSSNDDDDDYYYYEPATASVVTWSLHCHKGIVGKGATTKNHPKMAATTTTTTRRAGKPTTRQPRTKIFDPFHVSSWDTTIIVERLPDGQTTKSGFVIHRNLRVW